jgi:hypothetical protein
MRLRRGPREVYRVYSEDEAPDVDEWSQEMPTRDLAVEHPSLATSMYELGMDSRHPEEPTRAPNPEPTPRSSDGERFPRRPHARLAQLRRVAVMTLLGVGVGLVAALAIHSLRGSAVVDGRRAGMAGPAGAASLPPTSSPEPVAVTPAWARKPRAQGVSPVRVATVLAPRADSEKRKAPRHHDDALAHGEEAPPSRAALAGYTAAYATAATPGQGDAQAQPSAEAAASEFTFER